MNLTDKLFLLRGYGGDYVVRVWRRVRLHLSVFAASARAHTLHCPPHTQGDVPALTLADGTVVPPQNFHDGPQ